MAEITNPAVYLEYLRDVFVEGAEKPGGIVCRPELCRAFAAGLADLIDQVDTLAAYVDALGRAEQAAGASPRTPVERRILARLAVTTDPDATVVRFPAAAARPATATEGSPAA